jgi:demethylmenaquinone methyltransferase/2-methoxy-6-polyprenyl-1,4-benzoquinol methylase
MFMAVPPRYDLINQLITWGQDYRWRLLAARECLDSSPKRLLDICCGTGKLAIKLTRAADSSTRIVGVDFSLPMLEVAVSEARRSNSGERVSFVHGDAAALPFPDGHFDCVGIAFAFRNLTYKNPLTLCYLAEIVRVLRPGGRFVIVESSQPRVQLIRTLFYLYLRTFVFRVGYLLSGNRGAYRYLSESAARFYTPDELKDLLLSSGFSRFLTRPLMFGAVAIHTAVK